MASSEPTPELALIPSGDFLMGSEDAEEDERPVHRVHVDDFLMGVQPVTNADYGRFVHDTGHRTPAIYELPIVVKAGGVERERSFRLSGGPYVWEDGHPSTERADHPVTLVRYDDAVAYCSWLAASTGKPFRLPTEAEWEKAARGGAESKRYPWGDRLDRNMANFLVDPALKARGHAGNRRLHQQWCRFDERKKPHVVANVAVARQLAGWCWSLATLT